MLKEAPREAGGFNCPLSAGSAHYDNCMHGTRSNYAGARVQQKVEAIAALRELRIRNDPGAFVLAPLCCRLGARRHVVPVVRQRRSDGATDRTGVLIKSD